MGDDSNRFKSLHKNTPRHRVNLQTKQTFEVLEQKEVVTLAKKIMERVQCIAAYLWSKVEPSSAMKQRLEVSSLVTWYHLGNSSCFQW